MKSIKEKLAYFISGGLLVAVGMTLSPVTAQRNKFDEIECTSLMVVDSNGNARAVVKNVDDSLGGGIVELYNADGTKTVELYAGMPTGGYVRVWSKNDSERGHVAVQLETDTNGGRLDIYGKVGAVLKRGRQDAANESIDDYLFGGFGSALDTCVSVNVGSNGGGVVSVSEGQKYGKRAYLKADRIGVSGKRDGEKKGGVVELMVDEGGGRLDVFGGLDYKSRAYVCVDPTNGGGLVSVSNHDGEKKGGSAELTVNENGGRLNVFGKVDTTSRAIVGVNPRHGGGLVYVSNHDGEKKGGSAELTVNENGGRLNVFGKLDTASRAVIGINKNGYGIVQTWKKDGQGFHTLGDSTRVPSVDPEGGVIESKIDGDFEGWDGETVVKLMNGQIWKQTQYHYEYHYAFMPDVLIYKSGGRYKMLVNGTDEAVYVERLE